MVHELCIAQSFIPCMLLPLSLLANHENTLLWPKLTAPNPTFPNMTAPGRGTLGLVLGGLACVKLVDRLSKTSIISHRSAMFFEGIDAAMKGIGAVGVFLLFPAHQESECLRRGTRLCLRALPCPPLPPKPSLFYHETRTK